jgi:hypothetical protein
MPELKKTESSLFPHGSQAAKTSVAKGEEKAKKKKKKKADKIKGKAAGRM